MPIKHLFVTSKANSTDSTLVRPKDWNDAHEMTVTQPAVYGAIAAGLAGELPIDTIASGDTGHVMSSDAIRKLIADAIAGIAPAAVIITPGDITASFATAKTGWLLLDGKSIGNLGSGATGLADVAALNLFNLLWALNTNTWPVLPTRGATAAADWASTAPFKTIALPDARGRALVMLDGTPSVNSLITTLGQQAGAQKKSLSPSEQANMAISVGSLTGSVSGTFEKDDNLPPGAGNPTISRTGGAGQPQIGLLTLSGVTGTGGTTGGGGATGTAFDIVQPSLGVNYFIKL